MRDHVSMGLWKSRQRQAPTTTKDGGPPPDLHPLIMKAELVRAHLVRLSCPSQLGQIVLIAALHPRWDLLGEVPPPAQGEQRV